MEFTGFLVFLFISVLVLALGVSYWNVFGWHADLGISDQQAAQLYKTNPQDPQITAWQNGVQKAIDDFKFVCFGNVFDPEKMRDQCVASAKDINELCSPHPGQSLACLDPRISQTAGGAYPTTPSNSSSAIENTTGSSLQNVTSNMNLTDNLKKKQDMLRDRFDTLKQRLENAIEQEQEK